MTIKIINLSTSDANGYPVSLKIREDKPAETMTVIANSMRQIYFKNRGTERNREMVQLTGFDDAEGNNIFEGDIVEYLTFKMDATGYIGKVVFVHGSFFVDWVDPTFYPCLHGNFQLLPCHKEIKVIGNIFQNPELLERYSNEQ